MYIYKSIYACLHNIVINIHFRKAEVESTKLKMCHDWLQNLQQPLPSYKICSRQLRKHLNKNVKYIYKWKFNYCIELITLGQNEKLLVWSTFCHIVSIGLLLQRHQKAPICGKGLSLPQCLLSEGGVEFAIDDVFDALPLCLIFEK